MESIRVVTPIPGPLSLQLQQRRQANIPRGVGSALPIYIRRASGAVVEDIDGNQFLDFTGGIGTQNAGHCPPEAVSAIQDQAAKFLHTCFTVTPYEDYVRVAELLNQNTPGSYPKKTFLVNSGAEAVENAIKIARHYTKRQAIIAFEDGFHGRTQLAMSLTSKTKPYKEGFGPFAPEVYRIPYAYCYRCPINLSYPSCKVACAQELEKGFKRLVEADAVAAVIVEPVLGEGGFVAPPVEWFAEIAATCKAHGILLIADEIQTGFCRTGPLFACELFGVEPDILLSGKSIAAGLPLAAVTGRAEIMDSPISGGLGGTFSGNPAACAAAIQIFDAVDKQNLAKRSEEIGKLFQTITCPWKHRYPIIGDIRGVGAMRAIELVTDQESKEPNEAATKKILAACHQRGLLIISAGVFGNVIRMLVPLVASDAQIREGLQILEEAFACA